MHKPSPPILGVALATVVMMAAAATLQAEDKIEPVLRDVVAKVQVSVTYVPGTGFVAHGDSAKNAIKTGSARIAILPRFTDGKLANFGVVTWEPVPADRKEAATWPMLTNVKGAKAQRIATALQVSFAPVYEKEVLTGFRIATLASRKGVIVKAGEVTPASKEDKAAEIAKVIIALPKERPAGQWFGVMLIPVVDKESGKLQGFDATLVSTPAKKN